MSTYKVIDESTWKRAMHCKVFRDCVEPSYCLTLELDITAFLARVRAEGLSFTLSMIYTVSGRRDNATPLFDWGKYFERDGRIILPFSVQVHHSFVDGLHVGRFADALQKALNAR